MKYQRIVRIFLASPSDTQGEKALFRGVVDELNTTWSDYIGVRIVLVQWETDTWPSAGLDAQDVINREVADDYEILVGIMAAKLGSPTPRAGSGTVEEFERAYARRTAHGHTPDIMFYFRNSSKRAQAVASFQQRLSAAGVYYWSYRDERQFEQAARIHLSRQIQRLGRSVRQTGETDRAFPQATPSDLGAVLTQANRLLGDIDGAQQDYHQQISAVMALTDGFVANMQDVTRRLNRLKRPGFRPRPGARATLLRRLASDMDHFADQLTGLSPGLMSGYRLMVSNLGRALAIMAPVDPLPLLFAGAVGETLSNISAMGRALSNLRRSSETSREALAGWPRQDADFNRAHRRVLQTLDGLDNEFTDALHLTRELERSTEEFIEA